MTDRGHGDADGREYAGSTVHQEDAEQAGSAPVVPVGGRVRHVDHERFGNRADDEEQAKCQTNGDYCLAHGVPQGEGTSEVGPCSVCSRCSSTSRSVGAAVVLA
jgi:hypothetical protein